MTTENPEVRSDRVELAIQRWRTTRDVLWGGSRLAYTAIAPLVAGGAVVDVGCGIGAGTAVLARTAKSIVGVDKNCEAIAFARSMNVGVPLEAWDIADWPFPGRYDFVVSIECIEHISNALAALRNMMLMAKQVFVSTPIRQRVGAPANATHVREYTMLEFEQLVEATGIPATVVPFVSNDHGLLAARQASEAKYGMVVYQITVLP
jgi:2-polyprenyl-3-methyl-5-hydroxy-6-metoxy-1,4-benzoquinol methylase